MSALVALLERRKCQVLLRQFETCFENQEYIFYWALHEQHIWSEEWNVLLRWSREVLLEQGMAHFTVLKYFTNHELFTSSTFGATIEMFNYMHFSRAALLEQSMTYWALHYRSFTTEKTAWIMKCFTALFVRSFLKQRMTYLLSSWRVGSAFRTMTYFLVPFKRNDYRIENCQISVSSSH